MRGREGEREGERQELAGRGGQRDGDREKEREEREGGRQRQRERTTRQDVRQVRDGADNLRRVAAAGEPERGVCDVPRQHLVYPFTLSSSLSSSSSSLSSSSSSLLSSCSLSPRSSVSSWPVRADASSRHF